MSELNNKTYSVEKCLDKDGNLTGEKKELCEALLKSFQEMKPEEFAKYVVAYLDTDEIKAMCFFGFFDHSAIKPKLLEIQDEDQ